MGQKVTIEIQLKHMKAVLPNDKVRAEAERRLRAWSADGRWEESGASGHRTWHRRLIGRQAMRGVPRDSYWFHVIHDELGRDSIDHHSLWIRNKRPIAFVSQPYGFGAWTEPTDENRQAMKKWQAFADKHNLTFRHDRDLSWHYPGWTTLLSLEVKE